MMTIDRAAFFDSQLVWVSSV